MTSQIAIGVALFFLAMVCVGRANSLFADIVTAVKRALPEERAKSLSALVRHQYWEIVTEYRRLFPGGKLLGEFHMWCAAGFGCLIGMIVWWLFSASESSYILRQR